MNDWISFGPESDLPLDEDGEYVHADKVQAAQGHLDPLQLVTHFRDLFDPPSAQSEGCPETGQAMTEEQVRKALPGALAKLWADRPRPVPNWGVQLDALGKAVAKLEHDVRDLKEPERLKLYSVTRAGTENLLGELDNRPQWARDVARCWGDGSYVVRDAGPGSTWARNLEVSGVMALSIPVDDPKISVEKVEEPEDESTLREAVDYLVSEVARLQGEIDDSPAGKFCWDKMTHEKYVAIQPRSSPAGRALPVLDEKEARAGREHYDSREEVKNGWVIRDREGRNHVRPLEALTFEEPRAERYSLRHLHLIPYRLVVQHLGVILGGTALAIAVAALWRTL